MEAHYYISFRIGENIYQCDGFSTYPTKESLDKKDGFDDIIWMNIGSFISAYKEKHDITEETIHTSIEYKICFEE
jgi:hypothetical protein